MKTNNSDSGKEIGLRIIEVMEDLKYPPNKFASTIGVNKNSINNIIEKGSPPTYTLIDNLCNIFPVSNKWIFTGEGDKFTEKDVSEYLFRKRGVGEKVNPVINKRIRIIREDLNLSQTMFASELKLPRHTIANIENNKQNISATLMEKLILKYNVNLNWFIIGTGKPFLLSSSNKTNKGT